jgi:octaprenyl-diphosphate synthase
MSEGELLQIEKSRTLDITEDEYFEVIRKKTASLISTCCEAGAISVESNEQRDNMRMFGEKVGLAFQIKDDIFDYGSPNNIGKPTGIDIREQKLTLPIIYTLRNAPLNIQKELKKIIKNRNEEAHMIKRATNLVIEHGGITYAFERMNKLAQEAKDLLNEYPEGEAKEALIGLVNYTINREK